MIDLKRFLGDPAAYSKQTPPLSSPWALTLKIFILQ